MTGIREAKRKKRRMEEAVRTFFVSEVFKIFVDAMRECWKVQKTQVKVTDIVIITSLYS